jgi:methionine-gamma-lyase
MEKSGERDGEGKSATGRSRCPGVNWRLHADTELVSSDWQSSLRGGENARPPRPLTAPIYAASTYRLASAKEGEELSNTLSKDGYLYSRWGNPTVDAAASVLAVLEEAEGTLLFASGMSAIVTTLFTFLRAGDHAVGHDTSLCPSLSLSLASQVICQPCYGGVNAFVEQYLCHLGVEVTWVAASDLKAYKAAVKDNTRLLYTETPTNPTMSVVDLEALAGFARTLPNLVTAVDATFASPYLLQPIKLGMDISIHSCTKYLAGHTDLIGGCVSYSKPELGRRLHNTQLLMGPCMSPMDAFMLHRSLKTLGLRMERHSENAMAVAEFLEKHPKVARVYYPGLTSHDDHAVARRLMRRFSGMLSFELTGGRESGIRLVESVRVVVLALSLGGVESLIEHPASMTHCDNYVSPEVKRAGGITDGLIRLSVGIENVDDIIQDLTQALEKA